jgi:hypothetical protein
LFDLRQQPGVRIGVIVADGATMIYAPISKNIEAGSTSREHPNAIMLPETTSTSREHPNAIMLRDAAADRIAKAAGADNREDAQTPEVGTRLSPLECRKCRRT